MSESGERSESISHVVREQLLLLDPQLCIKDASKSYYSAFKVGPEQTLGNGQWNIPALLKLLNELPMVGGKFDDFEMGHVETR